MKNHSILLKIAAVLWIVWGLVHVFAGVMTMRGPLTGDISAAVSGIADAVDPATLQMDYPDAAGAVLGQHGFNLFWIGIVSFILAAITGGLADVGYFLFMDLGGYVNFMPGTVMTIFSGAAIMLSFYAYFSDR